MENRFGIKDFFQFCLILIVIVLSILGMIQVDRQWKALSKLQERSEQQGRDLIEIRRTLAEGIAVSTPVANGTAPTTQTASTNNGKPWADPFKPIKDVEKMPGFARGDWLIDNFQTKLKAITPYVGNDLYAYWVQAKVCEGLLYRDVDTLEFVPLLAKSWNVSPDGKTITFQLRRGVTFSDGMPLTADDVVFTFDWIRNPAINAPRERGSLDLLKEVKKLDDYTVEFTFKEFFFKSLETVGRETFILPKHFYSKYTPEQFNQTPGLLMGTGPYRMESPAGWTPGQKMIMYRNDRYWGTPPPPDRLFYLEVEEETANQTMFTNGDLDVFGATSEQYLKMKDDPKVLATANPMEYVSMVGGYVYIAWNEVIGTTPSVFADKRVRQAMTMLVDRKAICDQIFLGFANVADGPFAPGSKQRDPNVRPWPSDADRAKKLLAEVGIVDRDGDGVLDTPDGKPFRFKLTYPNKSAVYDRVTLFIKDGFAKAGIIMDRDPVEWPLLQKKLDTRDFDSIMLGWSGEVDEDPYQMFHSSQMADQGDNRMSYKNPELDDAIVAARTCVDDAKRLELWHKVHRIVAEDCPYTFLLTRKATVFINKRWQNVRTSTMGTNYNRLDYSPLPWFVPAGQQRYTK